MQTSDRRKELFTNAMSNLMKNKLSISIDLLNELINVDPGDKLALLARGSVYLKTGDTENAVDDFTRAIEIDSKHPKSYHLRGLAHEMAGNDDEALKDFDRAIEFDSEYGAAFFSRATLLTKMGQEKKALEDMEMVTHLSNLNIENFANENNVWRSRHMQMENMIETELNR
jgi:tetratricopeptide (TPR) repeat protein